jgi:hypothetical protein
MSESLKEDLVSLQRLLASLSASPALQGWGS